MKIKLNQKNEIKIKKAIKSGLECSFDFDDVIKMGDEFEKIIDEMGLPKIHRVGIQVIIPFGASPLPNSYKWRKKEQTVLIQRFPSGWFLTGVSDFDIPKRPRGRGNGNQYKIIMNEDQKKKLLLAMKIY